MDEDVVFVKKDTKIHEVLGAIKENKHIIVLDDNNEYYGILPRDVLVKVAFNLEAKVGNFAIRVKPISEEEIENLEKVVEKMISANVRALPVRKKDGSYGIVDIYYVLEKIKSLDFLKKEEVENYMHKEVITINERDPVTKAIALMKRYGISRLIVVDEYGYPVGMVTAGDIVRNILFEKERPRYGEISELEFSVEVRSIMSSPLLSVRRKDKLKKVVELLLENRIFALPVIENRNLYGIISAKEILAAYLAYTKQTDIKIVIHGITLDEYDQEWIRKRVEKLVQKFRDLIGENPTLIMHIKKIKSRYFIIRARLVGSKLSLYVSSEGYGLYPVLTNVLHSFKEDLTRIKTEKEKEYLLMRLLKEGL